MTRRIYCGTAMGGFTLIELMTAIVLVAIVSALAIPSMTNLMIKHRVQDAATGLYTSMFKARSEALRRVDVINLQPTDGTNWTSGWQVADTATPSNVLDEHEGTSKVSITLSGTSPIVYTATGRISSGVPTFTVTASNASYTCTYTVKADASGRPYETATRNGNTQVAGGGVPTC